MTPISRLHRLLRPAAALLSVMAINIGWAGTPAVVLDYTHAKVRSVMALQHLITPEVMKWPDVLGTAVGLRDDGTPDLVVYVDREGSSRAQIAQAFPSPLSGIAVRVELTDKFIAYAGNGRGQSGGSGVSHTAFQIPPIQLGTSGGWRYDLANGYCCGGTLGSLIQVNSTQYILSNYHVFESDIVSGGNNLISSTGNSVVQPGLIDVGCSASSAQNVGALVKLSSLPGANVDVSIAQVTGGMVRTDGAILEIGTLSSQTVSAFLNQAVKKSGRTSGLSRSRISGLNATISVQYENECAGGVAFTKTFSGQIVIANKASSFLKSGDSGSLMVEDVATTPRAVGLLFAGSSSSAIANPIGEVLQFVGGRIGGTATMVGN